MESKEVIEILNDLVQINTDRIHGFETALKDLEGDEELRTVFTNKIAESHQFKMALAHEVEVLGSDADTGSSISGKIHRTWLDLKASFSGHDEKSILEECEFGEDAIKRAYKTALLDEHLPAYLKDILDNQLDVLTASHDEIKALRDSAALRN